MTCRIGVTGVTRQWEGADRSGVNAAYIRRVLTAGAVPLVLPPLIDPGDVDAVLDGLHGLLFTGGEDVAPACYGADPSPLLGTVDPVRDRFELALFAAARRRRMPVLGICRGIQLINVALGGTLWQDLATEHVGSVEHNAPGSRATRTHTVEIVPGSRTALALGATAMAVNSFHHQAVRDLAPGLVASAWAPDGLLEAAEAPEREPWLVTVQWHPEELDAARAAAGPGLMGALAAEAEVWSRAVVG